MQILILLATLVQYVLAVSQQENKYFCELAAAFGKSKTELVGWSCTNNNPDISICQWGNIGCTTDETVQHIDLFGVGLTGSIPSTIGKLTSLAFIDLSQNSLHGTIPESIGDLSNLKRLYLDDNNLEGPIPESIGKLNKLSILYLNHNRLSGLIPSTMSSATSLKELHLNINSLSGRIPASIGQMKDLEILNLQSNDLSGPVPHELCNANGLQELVLYTESTNFARNSRLSCVADCLLEVANINPVTNTSFVSPYGNLPSCMSAKESKFNEFLSKMLISSSPTSAPTSNPPVCLQIIIGDTFGDGWHGARLLAFTSTGQFKLFSPDCGSSIFHDSFCLDPAAYSDGDSVILKVVGMKPSFAWEIFWHVLAGSGGLSYSGSNSTALTFTYKTGMTKFGETTRSLVLTKSVNIVTDPQTCVSCRDHKPEVHSEAKTAIADKKKPKPKPAPAVPATPPKKGPVSRSSDAALKSSTSYVYGGDRRRVLYQEVPTYQLQGYEGSWFHYSEGAGSEFFISNSDDDLEYSGTLCGEKGEDSVCDIELDDGTYYWRVASTLDRYVKYVLWDFCGVRGGGNSELKFMILEGECAPLQLRNSTQVCQDIGFSGDDQVESYVTLEGLLDLDGLVEDSVLEEGEDDVLRSAIAQELNDAGLGASLHSHKVLVTSYGYGASGGVRTRSVKFKATLKTSLAEKSEVVVALRSHVLSSIESGLFHTRVSAGARSTGVSSLRRMDNVDVNLMSLSMLHEVAMNSSMSFLAGLVTVLGGVGGLMAGAFLVRYFRIAGQRESDSSDVTLVLPTVLPKCISMTDLGAPSSQSCEYSPVNVIQM